MATRNDIENVILFRVFLGGRAGNQVAHFKTAFGKIQKNNKNIIVETKDVDDIKKQEWSPSQLIDWLLGLDVDFKTKTIFIILGHLHQVIYKYISYDIGKNRLVTLFTGTRSLTLENN